LFASGQVAQITYHLSRAMDNRLTQEQAGEVVTHLAFYAGSPNAFSALPVVKDGFEKRPHYNLGCEALRPLCKAVAQMKRFSLWKAKEVFSKA
jgi:hypothetical protein